jgi:hypothetical protein
MITKVTGADVSARSLNNNRLAGGIEFRLNE